MAYNSFSILLFSIEIPSGFADGALEVVDSGLGETMVEVVWVKVWPNPFEGVLEGYGCIVVWVSILL